MVRDGREMKAGLSDDGAHPNQAGCALMAPLVEPAVERALSGAAK